MNEKEKLIPQRRFKEFKNTGTWEKRKLGEFADISTGKLDANAMVEDGEYDFYTSGMKKYRIDTPAFEGPAITIAGNGATVGYMHLADGEFNAYQRTYVLQSFQANRYFLYSEISKKLPRKIAQEARTGNIPYIVMDMLTELTISLPVLEEEQAKIGAFFKQLDNTIALHQRKLEKSKALKSAYLSEMFPVEGERKPKRRFAGFTDDWEQRKLGETVQITMGQSPGGENYTENPKDYILVQGNADMKNGKVVPRVWTTQVTKKADPEDIILSVRAPVGDVGKTDYPVVLGRGVAGIKGNAFIFQTLSRMKEIGFWTRYSSGSTFESINSADLKDAVIQIPNIEEQIKIGEFFTKLDDTIALHQHKLEKLKNIKQAYLNEMFI